LDHILDTYEDELTEEYIKDLHRILKTGTISSGSFDAVVGEYKKYANEVADIRTTLPENVSSDMKDLIGAYEGHANKLKDIVTFHVSFEKIHPFYDGNGRVGRLIMFKECLRNKILPFIVNDQDKLFYYTGLKEWQTEGKTQRLMETIRLMQDDMESVLRYFDIEVPARGDEQ
jgi:Fic family protein